MADDFEFLELEAFQKRFPYGRGNLLDAGTYGTVFTRDNYVVKVQYVHSDTNFLEAAIREIIYYTMIYHPCVMKPYAWTYEVRKEEEDVRVFLAMPKGIPIKKAYEEGLITLNALMEDLLSAVHFLYKNRVVNLDLKTSNIIYLNGKATLIDFGFARETVEVLGLHRNQTDIATIGTAFSQPYRDPEYVKTDWNSTRTMAYTLARIFYEIANKVEKIEHEPNFYEFSTSDPTINWLIREATRPIAKRLSLSDFLKSGQKPYGDRHTSDTGCLRSRLIFGTPDCNRVTKETMLWMFDRMQDVSTNAFFYAIHLYQRMVNNTNPTTQKECRQLGVGCLLLASLLRDETAIDPRKYRYDSIEDQDSGKKPEDRTEESITISVLEILRHCDGQVQMVTLWDYANAKEDLQELLEILFAGLPKGAKLPEVSTEVTSKEWRVRDLKRPVVDWSIPTAIFSSFTEKPKAIFRFTPDGEDQILELLDEYTTIENTIAANGREDDYELYTELHNVFGNLFNTVFHFRSELPKFSQKAAVEIYKILHGRCHMKNSDFLHSLLSFHYTEYPPGYFIDNPTEHPFK
jgi:serine/threonine protein kinase